MPVLVPRNMQVRMLVRDLPMPMPMRMDQVHRKQQLHIRQHLIRRRVGDQAMILAEHQRAVGEVGQQRQIVCGRDERQSGVVQFLEQLQQHRLAARVEPRGGLVEQQDGGAHDEEGGERDALLLAAAEALREAGAEVEETEQVQRIVEAGADFTFRPPQLQRAESQFIFDGGVEELRLGVLKQKADFLTEACSEGGVFERLFSSESSPNARTVPACGK